jgi:hypothetical protein
MIVKFVPAIWSKKTTPLEYREYILEGYANGPCGCVDECKEWAKENGYSAVFKTLEGKVVK